MTKRFKILLDVNKEHLWQSLILFMEEWESLGIGSISDCMEFIYDEKNETKVTQLREKYFPLPNNF